MAVFWVVTPCRLYKLTNISEVFIAPVIRAMLVNSYQSTRRYNPDDSHLHTHRRKNLKSYTSVGILTYIYIYWTSPIRW
jgi:hypothetical protein